MLLPLLKKRRKQQSKKGRMMKMQFQMMSSLRVLDIAEMSGDSLMLQKLSIMEVSQVKQGRLLEVVCKACCKI